MVVDDDLDKINSPCTIASSSSVDFVVNTLCLKEFTFDGKGEKKSFVTHTKIYEVVLLN